MKLTELTARDVETITGEPFELTGRQCHGVCLTIVQSGFGSMARVARGWCEGVRSQHSWIVIGEDCYASDARIVDPTLWSYDETIEGVWHGTAADGRHQPHGAGSIWTYGRPADPKDTVIELAKDPGDEARTFLEIAAPAGLDRTGWAVLAGAPVGDWPAAEIIDAMCETPELAGLVPIDIVGMLTDRNPNGLYR